MQNVESREALINEFFTYNNASDIKDVEGRIKRLRAYLASNELDKEVDYILIVMLVSKEDYKSKDFNLCKKMALPVFDLLKEADTRTLSFVEITILAKLIAFAPTFELAKECIEKILELLEAEYKTEKRRNAVKAMVSYSAVSRLVKAKYPAPNSLKTEADRNEIDALFKHHLKICKTVFEENNLPRYNAFVQMWEGIFHMDAKLLDKGLIWLKENTRKTWYHVAVNVLFEYYPHLGESITKNQIDTLVGYRIDKLLESKNMSREEAAEALELSLSGLNQILTARRGAKSVYLYKLSELCDVNVSYFFYGEEKKNIYNDDEKLGAAVDEIGRLLEGSTDSIKQQVIDMIKVLTRQ